MRLIDRGNRYVFSALVSFACCTLNAQTPELQTYSAEYTIPLANLGVFPAPTTIPPNVLQALQGGAVEIRHALTFTASNRTLSVRTFLVAPGSPNPTPTIAQTMLHEAYEVSVQNVLWTPQTILPPGSTGGSLVITGRISSGALSIGGNIANKLFVHSAGFDNVTPLRLNNITTIVAGSHTMYAQQGTGTLTFGPAQPGGPGTGGNQAPQIVATAGIHATTANSEIQLDASGSTDPSGGTLTYSWRSIGKSAAVIEPNSAKPRVQFVQGFGEYIFEVTVTSSNGLSSTAQVKVMYVGR